MDGTAPLPSPATLRRLAARANIVRTQERDIPSPCINVCRIDPVQSLCTGCYRSLDEIAAWSLADEDIKRQIWGRIAQRLPVLTPNSETPMKHITFYLDFISPYAYLAFEELPKTLMGLSYSVTYKPMLFAALLKHHGQLGPAEIAPKRDWTYRQVLWQAHARGIQLDMPAAHPFNPLGLLRLAIASQAQGLPNRYVCETLFRHVWTGGADASDGARLAALTKDLAPERDPSDATVKEQLKANAEDAIAAGVFGVPSMVVDGKVFWGLDALPMLCAYLDGNPWFADTHWDGVIQVPSGLDVRRPDLP